MKDLVSMKNKFKELYDGLEINPVKEYDDGLCEVCEEGQETFWTIYGHLKSGGVNAIADVPVKEDAFLIFKVLQEQIF